MASTDTYIEKESTINDEIDRLRLSATRSLFERREPVVIVASVSMHLWPGISRSVLRHVVDARKGASASLPPRDSYQGLWRSCTSGTTLDFKRGNISELRGDNDRSPPYL